MAKYPNVNDVKVKSGYVKYYVQRYDGAHYDVFKDEFVWFFIFQVTNQNFSKIFQFDSKCIEFPSELQNNLRIFLKSFNFVQNVLNFQIKWQKNIFFICYK